LAAAPAPAAAARIHAAHPHAAVADIAALPAPLAEYAAQHGLAPVPGIAAGGEPAVAVPNVAGGNYRMHRGQLWVFRGNVPLRPAPR
jgi:hypothetical protein